MKVDFLGAARRELDEAAGFYKSINPLLGKRFLDQAQGHSRWIKRFSLLPCLRHPRENNLDRGGRARSP